ncbi:thiamine phosphate synthase [Brevibacterium jeotgali]|uniref:Thiamine-phosphate synthase n=1 Tax=Brevibacterium jeotgali TaxID=1262550 RepID=A0A2H1L6C4_9MICO|nr:thiamine phosphate synthase [Brevibacterium jeotgali]TWB98870.1 thiamine-phosphate pyrophosphorylase [Brevibacterium jeotgali]SMY12300.1 thiamine-phosphate diphosphorylase [Brevibacterium jeotgali]
MTTPDPAAATAATDPHPQTGPALVLPARLAPYDWSLYLVTDTEQCAAAGRTVPQTAAEAVAGGAGIVQIRDKHASDAEVAALTRDTISAIEATGRSITPVAASGSGDVPGPDASRAPGAAPGTDTACAASSDRPVAVFVDDRLEVVKSLRAEGLDVHVHVGQTDEPVEDVRAALGPEPLVGLSAGTPAEFSVAGSLRDAATGAALVDLVGIGPVHDTTTKEGAPAGIGPERTAALASIAAEMGLPAVAIGGITADRAHALRDAPTLGLCVVSAICTADDPRAAAHAIRSSCPAA